MPTRYAALCTDHYINQRINLKMDLPMRRDTVLALFDRVRRELPYMERFKRYRNELALESTQHDERGQEWLALRKTSIRSGSVNPDTRDRAYRLHNLVLEVAPYFLDISPLDIDHVELLYGFDFLALGNHDAIIFDALLSNSPLAALLDENAAGTSSSPTPIDCQPYLGLSLNDDDRTQVHFEVKTRQHASQRPDAEPPEQPISVYLTIRSTEPVNDIKQLPAQLARLTARGDQLLESRVVPNLLTAIRDSINAAGYN